MPIRERGGARVIDHTLAEDTLTRLRDSDTEPQDFRDGLAKIGRICGYELADDLLETQKTEVQTPVSRTESRRMLDEDLVIINVLRAATPFVEGVMDVLPKARQGVISASRRESSEDGPTEGFPVTVEYLKLPEIDGNDKVVIADPMLATASTMSAVVDRVVEDSPKGKEMVSLSVVSAPEGIERLNEAHPGVDHITVSIDDCLDDDGYILPGLGDAGDRAFRTV